MNGKYLVAEFERVERGAGISLVQSAPAPAPEIFEILAPKRIGCRFGNLEQRDAERFVPQKTQAAMRRRQNTEDAVGLVIAESANLNRFVFQQLPRDFHLRVEFPQIHCRHRRRKRAVSGTAYPKVKHAQTP